MCLANIILVLPQQRFIPSLWFSEGFISSSNPKSVAGIGPLSPIASSLLLFLIGARQQIDLPVNHLFFSCQVKVYSWYQTQWGLESDCFKSSFIPVSAIIYYQSDCHYPLSPVDRCISRLWYVSDKSPQLTETLPGTTKDDAVADRRGVCPGTSHWGKSVWLVVIFPWKSGWLLVNFLWNFTLLSPSVDSSWDEFQDS